MKLYDILKLVYGDSLVNVCDSTYGINIAFCTERAAEDNIDNLFLEFAKYLNISQIVIRDNTVSIIVDLYDVVESNYKKLQTLPAFAGCDSIAMIMEEMSDTNWNSVPEQWLEGFVDVLKR